MEKILININIKKNVFIKESSGFKAYYLRILKHILIISLLVSILLLSSSPSFINNKNADNKEKTIKSNSIINTKIKSLSQFLMNSFQTHLLSSNKAPMEYSVFIKAKYDIYTLKETLLSENEKDSKIFTTAVIINSQCLQFKEGKKNCELEDYLNLFIKNKSNLKIKNENIEELKEVILPICLFEHTDNNNILYISCPETLSKTLKNNIISAFQGIKPLLLDKNLDNNLIKTTITDDEKTINISISDKRCNNIKENDQQKCEIIKNFTIDKLGNMKASKIITKLEINKSKDKSNKYYSQLNTTFEDVSNKNDNKLNEANFKKNLNILLHLINPLMKKEQYFTKEIKEENENDAKNNRKLEDDINNLSMKDQAFFNQSILGVDLILSLKNDFGFGKNEKAKIISNLIRGSKRIELSHDELFTNLHAILNKFITLSQAGNKLANQLYKYLIESLTNLKKDIISNINDLNNLLHFDDLSSLFDSTLAINYLSILPKNKIKNNISCFLNDSHQLLNNILLNITELNELLSSNESKISKVIEYYSKNENNSYIEVIQEAKTLFNNYHMNEKILIESYLNNIFSEFSSNFSDSLRISQTLFDNIINKINNKTISIESGNNNDLQNIKNNLQNAKLTINKILSKIENIIKNRTGIYENGYYETQKELNDYKNNYENILNKSFNISNDLNKNLFSNKRFDDIVSNIKNHFYNILKSIDKSKREKFPLKYNKYVNSSFIRESYNQMDKKLNEEKIKIISYVTNEINQHTVEHNNLNESFVSQNKNNLDNIFTNINNLLSDNNFHNIDLKFDDMLTTTFNSINSIINNNKDLAQQYINNVANSNPYYHTQLFLNKAQTFFDSFTNIKNFITQTLSNNLKQKYQLLNEISIKLKNILANEYIKNYSNDLPFLSNYINIITNVKNRYHKYFSSELYEQKYLTKINNYIETTKNNINNIENSLKNTYNNVKSVTYSGDTTYDYFLHRQNCYKYCASKFIWCWKEKTRCDDYYDGYTVDGTNNHLSLKSINFNEYTTNYDSAYNNINSKILKDIPSFNNIINTYGTNMNAFKSKFLNKKIDYLNNISQKINYYINDEFCNNYTIISYNYYKNEIQEILIQELNNTSNQIKILYNELKGNISSNINDFKNPIEEIGVLMELYYKMYLQNISYDFTNSIIEQRKNDFNYSLEYYYNHLLSKVNKTFSYILNHLPISDQILVKELNNKLNNEINTFFNNMINSIVINRNKYLQKEKQLNIIKVKYDDFFNMNSNIEKNKKDIEGQLKLKSQELLKDIEKIKKLNTNEVILSKIYLDNLINEKPMKDIYDTANKDSFIDLQSDVYKYLIQGILEINQDELIQNIKNYLVVSNNLINEDFKKEKEKYDNILKNKIYNEFYTKDNLENIINNIYSNGLVNLDTNSKNSVNGYLNEVLNRIKTHSSNEVKRLNDELTSYSNNYTLIKKRFNDYKSIIYDKFYSTILSVNNKFYSDITKKFYTNYIEKYLNEYISHSKNIKYKESKFLNTSINLKNIQNEIIDKYTKEYKDLVINNINFLNTRMIQTINDLFSFSDIKTRINQEIDKIYNNQLLPILKQKAIYNIADSQVSNYDLSNNILNDINSFIDKKINEAQLVINKMKGKKYDIPEDWKKVNFNNVEKEEFLNIQISFDKFYKKYYDKEILEINELITFNIKNNFQMIIENFIPSFGKDFFDRIIKYNQNQNIKSLYNNIKYSIQLSLNYYKNIFISNPSIIIQKNIKNKILSLNNIDSFLNLMKNDNNLKLSYKLDKLFEETKGNFVDQYIYFLKIDDNIKSNFDKNIISILDKILDDNSKYFENEYSILMNKNVKNTFIEQYKKILNEENNKMKEFIQENKNIINYKINNLTICKTDNILLKIRDKSKDILNEIKKYNLHFNSFFIPDEICIFLNNFIKTNIVPYYQGLKNIIDFSAKDIIINNLNENIKTFKSNYIYDTFNLKTNSIREKFKNIYFENITNYLKNSYGVLNTKYSELLEKEIIEIDNLRKLEDSNINKQEIGDIKLDKTFKLLKNTSNELMNFIDNLNLFSSFEEKIKKYLVDINEQYIVSQNNIKNMNNDEKMNKNLNQHLTDLKNYIIQYYNKVNASYYQTKAYISISMNEINFYLEQSANVTYDLINNKYKEIKSTFSPINNKINEQKTIEINKHTEKINEVVYIVETEIDKYYLENEISIELIFEQGDIIMPKIKGKIINKSKPNRMVIDLYSNYGNICEIKGRRMTINFNNVSFVSDFVYESSLNKLTLNNTIDFSEYNIRNEKYIIIEEKFIKVLGGIKFILPTKCKSTLDGESEVQVIDDVTKNNIEIYEF